MSDKYGNLMQEVECIKQAWAGFGILEALQFIDENFEEYRGTTVGREFRMFMNEGRMLFKEVA